MNLNAFTSNLQKYADVYNPHELFDKIKNVARKAGVKIIYIVLLLYYSTLDKEGIINHFDPDLVKNLNHLSFEH